MGLVIAKGFPVAVVNHRQAPHGRLRCEEDSIEARPEGLLQIRPAPDASPGRGDTDVPEARLRRRVPPAPHPLGGERLATTVPGPQEGARRLGQGLHARPTRLAEGFHRGVLLPGPRGGHPGQPGALAHEPGAVGAVAHIRIAMPGPAGEEAQHRRTKLKSQRRLALGQLGGQHAGHIVATGQGDEQPTAGDLHAALQAAPEAPGLTAELQEPGPHAVTCVQRAGRARAQETPTVRDGRGPGVPDREPGEGEQVEEADRHCFARAHRDGCARPVGRQRRRQGLRRLGARARVQLRQHGQVHPIQSHGKADGVRLIKGDRARLGPHTPGVHPSGGAAPGTVAKAPQDLLAHRLTQGPGLPQQLAVGLEQPRGPDAQQLRGRETDGLIGIRRSG